MTSHPSSSAAIIGASGGIGRALVAQLSDSTAYAHIHALSRTGTPPCDPTNEATIIAAAATITLPLALTIVTTGMLHDDQQTPEKSLRDLDAARLTRSFAINTIAPALVAKHFIPLMPKTGRAVFAALGARVGSIGDNRTGGWHGYRASKAALVMVMKTIAIEVARTRPDAIIVTLHPGTVDTAMSKPFQRGVASDKLFTAETAAAHLLRVIDGLTPADSGGHFAWDGVRIAE